GPWPGQAERPMGIDQSNTSYVVGERVVVKLFRRIWPGAHPEIEIVEYLSGRVGSVPAFAGAVEWRGHGVALLQEYVPGGRDGWTWCGDAMLRSFDHLGRYVEHERWPGHRTEIERWIEAARTAFLAGYGPVDATLLRALEFEKECYEFTYAADFEP